MMFLAGFAACQVFGESPIVLLLLIAFVAAGAVVCACFELTLKLPKMRLNRLMTGVETKPVQQETFVLGVGHQVRR
jgi:uncharacterized membrane protein YciS (DUF1049 family)